ncbi:hypothetical protein FRD01_14720 [Microvenator marinus]|uniref:Uncharacterized protein n=1 Tax=Microvenator marinus TaxID=2600177 RepID=A0A5B8XXI9_9DELT|nr:hypothetical protein FRD01_14720 [Microvenator marinus]
MLLLLALTFCFAGDAGAQDATQSEAVKEEKPKAKKKLTDKQIAKILIKESIDSYSGNCPCPYHSARNGSRCGKRSAYSRPGGASPLCYASDVSSEMIQEYRDSLTE